MKKSVSAFNVGILPQSYPRVRGPPLAVLSTVPAVNLASTASWTSGDMRCCTSLRLAKVGMRERNYCKSVRFNSISAAHL